MPLIINERKIYYDKSSLILFLILFSLIPLSFFLYDYFTDLKIDKDNIFLFLFSIGALFYYWKKIYLCNEPQIIISKSGIKLYNKDFISWENIVKTEIIDEQGEDAVKELRIKTKGNYYVVNLFYLDIESGELNGLIRKYHKY